MPEYVTNEYLEPATVEDRDYQTELVNAAAKQSTLIALPTGAGKTPVAIRLAARRLRDTDGRVLMLAPQVPLVKQQARAFREMTTLAGDDVVVFTGQDTPPKTRERIWNGNAEQGDPRVIVATPQTIAKDLLNGAYRLDDVAHLIVDECHRATGDYDYVYIGEEYNADRDTPYVTGLSASPGSDRDSILEVCHNLGITNIEIKTENDNSVQEYLGNTNIERRFIEMPDVITDGTEMLREVYKEAQKPLKRAGVLNSASKSNSFNNVRRSVKGIKKLEADGDDAAWECYSYRAMAMKIHQVLTLLETQGVEQAKEKLIDLNEEAQSEDGTKAAKRIVSHDTVQEVYQMLRNYDGQHPKLQQIALEAMSIQENNGRMIVFTESRATVQRITEYLNTGSTTAKRLVGQSNKDGDPGMTQTEQRDRLDAFEDGEFEVLVSTSVGEEGLDIPGVETVMFYEPVPDSVRTIQRRGRTGRQEDGGVIILIGEGTSDERANYIAKNREDQMKEDMAELKQMESDLRAELETKQETLAEIGGTGNADTEEDGEEDTRPLVKADHREQDSGILKRLRRDEDVQLEVVNNMEVGDFVASDRVGIERKAADDFLATLVGERSFDQYSALADSYEVSVVIVEATGVTDLYGRRAIPDEAIRSAVETLSADYGMSVMFTGEDDVEESANLISTYARREQEDNDRSVSMHSNKSSDSLSEQQLYVVSSIAGVGPGTAETLLQHFGSVRAVFTASEDELTDVSGVGEKRAETVTEIVGASFGAE